jgi:hypothetical protein
MENLDWLEWSPVTTPLTFNVTQHGVFPKNITTIELSRDADLRLIAIGRGQSKFWHDEQIKLPLGESASDFYSQETIGQTRDGYTVRLIGVFAVKDSKTRTILDGEDTVTLLVEALVSEAKVTKTSLPISTHIEWVVNFLTERYSFTGGTKRENLVIFKRDRLDGNIVEYCHHKNLRTTSDYFKCECILSNKKWSLIVGKVIEEVAPKKYNPGFVEFENINTNKSPTEETKQNILAALSFALGRQLVSVGSTSLSHNNYRVGFTAKINSLFYNHTYINIKSSSPPIPLNIPEQNLFIVEKKISRIISAVVTQMESINIRSSLYFVWTGLASPLDVQAAHIGAAIECLRDSYCKFYKNKLSTQLVDKKIWKKRLKEPLLTAFDEVMNNIDKVDSDEKSLEILRKKLENINYKSSNMQYDEFFSVLSLPVGEVEKAALQERNKPAHGHFYQDSDYQQLSITIGALYSLFNRLVIKMTDASDCYIDYSSYARPVRHIDEPLGGPEGDGKPAFSKNEER